ncbi:MAG: hypothetical protein H6737_02070 [Alphaproteobacteria bacterium]|nr:hypothetical protein [Alphaproteobacteria bacterium]
MALLGCKPAEQTTPTPELPTDTSDTDIPWVDTGVFRPDNTGSVALGNDVPLHTVILEQSGIWNLSGNPYNALIGSFRVREVVDNQVPDTAVTGDTADDLACNVRFSMQGTPAPQPNGCPNCSHVWDIQFTIDADSETGTGACVDPDLPQDGDTWRMGFAQGQAVIFFNFYGTGIYVPWWGAVQSGDSVVFEWSRELAIALEEDDQ